MPKQTIKGTFTMTLAGIPVLLFLDKLILKSESGHQANGYGIHIGPFLIGVVTTPKFKKDKDA